MTQRDAIMDKIAAGQQHAVAGDRASAHDQFAELWEQIGADGDPLHVVSLAHYMADVQEDPSDQLDWDLRALRAADQLTDERAQQYHAALAIRGFYPSLRLNLAADYAKLRRPTEAQDHLSKAEATSPDLPDGDYATMIRESIARLRHELTDQGEVS